MLLFEQTHSKSCRFRLWIPLRKLLDRGTKYWKLIKIQHLKLLYTWYKKPEIINRLKHHLICIPIQLWTLCAVQHVDIYILAFCSLVIGFFSYLKLYSVQQLYISNFLLFIWIFVYSFGLSTKYEEYDLHLLYLLHHYN